MSSISKSRIFNKYRLILLFITIYCSQSTFALNLRYPGLINIFMIGVAVLVTVSTLWYRKGLYISKNAMVLLLLISANMLITAVFNADFSGGYILVIISYFQAIVLSNLYKREEFFEDYIKCFVFLIVVAIISQLLVMLNRSFLSGLPILTNSKGDQYIDFLFAIPSVNLAFFRINSIWGEAGMFGVFIGFALIFELFMVPRFINKTNLSIIIVGAICTMSATTFVVLVISYITFLFKKSNIRDRKVSNKMLLIIPIIVVATVALIMFLSPSGFESTFSKFKFDNISFRGRVMPIIYNYSNWLRSPIYGNGLINLSDIVQYIQYGGEYIHIRFNTTTSLIILNYFGIIYFLIHCYLIVAFVKRSYASNVLVKVLLLIMVFININTQALEFDQTLILILTSSLMQSQFINSRKGNIQPGKYLR